MEKKERGIITVESSMVLMLITLFILFLFSFGRVYRAQNLVSHAVLQSADAVALESYLRETAFENDVNDVVNLASHITSSSAISSESLESLRTANIPKIAKDKFFAAIASTKEVADAKLRSLGVKDGIDGIDFSECKIDLTTDDVIVAITYTIEMQYPVFGANEITVTKAAKAKTFGEILFAVTTKPNVPGWGTTSGDDKVTHGSTVQITAEPNYGYIFVGWEDGVTDQTRDVVVEDAQNYVAIFEKDKFGINLSTGVTYDSDYVAISHNNYGTTSGAGNFLYLDTAVIKATPTQNYEFCGWDDNGDGQIDNTSATRSITVDKTYNIKAIFKPKTYTIKVKVNNGSYGSATVSQGSKSGSSISAEYGSQVQLVAVSSNDIKFKFEKWSNNSTQASTSVSVQGDTTYEAGFYENVYTVTFKNGSTNYHTTKVIRGSSIDGSKEYTAASMPSNPKKDGAQFSRWVNNGVTFSSSTRVNSNITVNVVWKYTVKLNANGGLINGNSSTSKTVEGGTNLNFDDYEPSRSGYTFTGWYNGSTLYSGSKTINSNITVEAGWSCNHSVAELIDDESYQPYCRDIYSNGSLKSGTSKGYGTYKCSTCGEKFTVESDSFVKHYRMDLKNGYELDDFGTSCSVKHGDTHYGFCGKYYSESSGNKHNWDGYYHIICDYCYKETQGFVWCYVAGELKYYDLHRCAIHNAAGSYGCPG